MYPIGVQLADLRQCSFRELNDHYNDCLATSYSTGVVDVLFLMVTCEDPARL
jgi:hypothetical protein